MLLIPAFYFQVKKGGKVGSWKLEGGKLEGGKVES